MGGVASGWSCLWAESLVGVAVCGQSRRWSLVVLATPLFRYPRSNTTNRPTERVKNL